MQAHYRADYPGEFVVVETRWSGGRKQQEREWVANPIENHHISHRAACIGTPADFDKFDYTRLQRHRGGLLGSKKLQTYGTGIIAQQMRLDFTVELDPAKLQELVDANYDESNIVYSSVKHCLAWPGRLYLIPYMPRFSTECLPVYLAAFDGHTEIFLLGYHRDNQVVSHDWVDQLNKIFATYSATTFFLVGEKTNMAESLFDHTNVKSLSVREFVSYCDV